MLNPWKWNPVTMGLELPWSSVFTVGLGTSPPWVLRDDCIPVTVRPGAALSRGHGCEPVTPSPLCYQAAVTRGPLVVLLSHWSVPQWAPRINNQLSVSDR